MNIMRNLHIFAWMQGWWTCDLSISSIMNENYCALVCECILQKMNGSLYEQDCMIKYMRDIYNLKANHGSWMQELVWDETSLLHMVKHSMRLMI